MFSVVIKSTPFGPVGVIWTESGQTPKVIRIFLSNQTVSAESRVHEEFPNAKLSSCSEIDDLAADIAGILDGDTIEIALDIATMDLCSPFQQSVLKAEHAIPRGSVSTYQLIASHLGKPTGARAVGTALALNPFPLIVPCHRAIRTDLSLGGYQGGLSMKQALLEKEGIIFSAEGHVIVKKFHYQ